MQILFLPHCSDVVSLHAYMKTNYQIEESNQVTLTQNYDANGNPLASIMAPPMFHPQSPYQLINWQKENGLRSFGNGVSSFRDKGYTVIVLPDGYSITQAQLNAIGTYASSLPAPANPNQTISQAMTTAPKVSGSVVA